MKRGKYQKKSIYLIIILFIGAVFLSLIGYEEPIIGDPYFGNTLYVGGGGSGNFSTIQSAIMQQVLVIQLLCMMEPIMKM